MPASTPIDFSQTDLAAEYSTFYAKVLDDVFTPDECSNLIALASKEEWKHASLSAERATQSVHTNFRNSDRALLINEDAADMIYDRIRPMLEEIHEIPVGGKWSGITGKATRKQGPTWKLVGVNPRLSFLRYGSGHYFKPHCDGIVDLHDGVQRSFVTIHLYLGSEYVQGGATRFWTPDKKRFIDVEPTIGRVLVFQQRMLIHSGEEVTDGLKYSMRTDLMFEQT